jgi:hypothetical protein
MAKAASKRSVLKPTCSALCKVLAPASMRRWSLRAQQFRFLPQHLPEALRQRLADEGIEKTLAADFNELHRSHPLVSVLAEHLLESQSGRRGGHFRSLRRHPDRCRGGTVTTVYLLRLRHQLGYVRRREPFQMMAEETVALSVAGRINPQWLDGDAVARLLECTPSGNLPVEAMQREIRTALDFIVAHPQQLKALAEQRANALLADHQRVREAARDVGQYSVSACLPVDVMGVYVLLPDAVKRSEKKNMMKRIRRTQAVLNLPTLTWRVGCSCQTNWKKPR